MLNLLTEVKNQTQKAINFIEAKGGENDNNTEAEKPTPQAHEPYLVANTSGGKIPPETSYAINSTEVAGAFDEDDESNYYLGR